MKILLIDSEIEDIRELKKRIHWEACGVESAATAYSERTARETAKNQKPDLIVCCTEIAEDGGEALLTELRSTVPNAGIILTGSRFSEEIFRRLLYVEAVDYLKNLFQRKHFSRQWSGLKSGASDNRRKPKKSSTGVTGKIISA